MTLGLTLGDLARGLREQLAEAGVPDADESGRRIAAAAAGCRLADFALAPQTPMTVRMVAHADTMAARRCDGEPLQYVLGSWGFRRLDLAVDSRALIPRPETEQVAGIAIDWLGSQPRRRAGEPFLVADMGTGCGAIALAIADEVSSARVFATDISTDALSLAAANLAGLGVAGARVSLHGPPDRGDWFEALEGVTEPGGLSSGLRGRLDAVVSNPPYVADGEVLPPEVLRWEPHEALYAGPDGLSAVRRLVRGARSWLTPGGLLVLEIGSGQGAAAADLAISRGYDEVRIEPDLAGLDRALVAFRPADEPDAATLQAAENCLAAGGFVVAPTDTICGVMACYADSAAVRQVCEAKQRPHSEPMPILVSGLAQAEKLAELSPLARSLAHEFWPGGLTLVARRRGGPDPLHGRETLGVRAPALGWLRLLIDEAGPVTGTSANRHGHETPADARTAADGLALRPSQSAVIAGTAPGGVASTVVDVSGDEPQILRAGAVPAEEIRSFLGSLSA